MAVLVYKHNQYALEVDRSKGRFYIDGKLMFKGFAYTAIKMYIGNVPEHRHKFKNQLNMRQKVEFKEKNENWRFNR